MHKLYIYLASFLLLNACDKQQLPHNTSDSAPIQAIEKLPVPKPAGKLDKGTFCFKKSLNQDVTNVKIIISGDDVSGFMNWIPYQKDSARGTLKGTQNQSGELDLMYDYMIEGNQQSETKIMKIENDQLWVKKGELTDPKNDGHLVYKDASQAKYDESLEKANCKTLTE